MFFVNKNKKERRQREGGKESGGKEGNTGKNYWRG
jgi:hypothetical protein